MMKTLYAAAWMVVTLMIVVTLLTDYFSEAVLVALGLAALALVFGLALWSVITNTQDEMPKVFHRNDRS